MDDFDEPIPLESADPETRQLLGLFDVPAFARRGQDLEYTLARLHARCDRERSAMLEMVRLRLRQWSALATGPDDWSPPFAAPVAPLWPPAGSDPPAWAARPGPGSRRRAVARDLVASLERFNRRWARFLGEIDLGPINRLVDHYNRYYLLEKECVLGSSRLASRHFVPREPLTREALRASFPELPVPDLI